ncbi:hypothetical protein NUU61_000593 [Penicillium alfredii]|uniref:PH-response regulator protein palI/RIM9 n=1 Tax=Penicillium alfredii TaxID=1506179 RepID=A0A9W9G9W3_9EURO|nr:uncharacterized protein NUU61_000593 [Penicillium alfredii]KAJ5114834.1 hypothetical protein NUU61_000593 [Penicillium alfredii]
MLLKPATPLTVLLLVAFALLLVSCLSTPIIKGIPLATYKDVDYGVFGYCKGSQCTNIHVGYTSNDINSTGDDFNLPSGTRESLSSILIVHPVAAFLTLICLCLAAAAHFHSPSHSPRFLLALLILLLPTLLVTLLAFLVDILLFVPHLQWGGWIVLAATIILVSCGVVTCAMRRTLVSRKARKQRIAENAEMSGENFYNRQNAATTATPVNEAKEAMVSGSPTSESGPNFATFRTETRDSDDDRTPLNARTPLNDVPVPPESHPPSRRPTPYRPPQEEANSMPPPGAYGAGMMHQPSDPRLRPQYSDGSMGPRRGGGPPGFSPRPYMGPRGPPPGPRGGYMGPMPPRGRGGMMRGPPRGPPVGYAPSPHQSFDSYGRPMPPPGDDPYEPPSPISPIRHPSPGPIGMAVSPETDGQAIEMTPQARRYDGHDSMGTDLEPHAVSMDGHLAPLDSPSTSSMYSRTESYVPARAGWSSGDDRRTLSPRPPMSPLQSSNTNSYYEDVEPQFARRPSPRPSPGGAPVPSALTPGAHCKFALIRVLHTSAFAHIDLV